MKANPLLLFVIGLITLTLSGATARAVSPPYFEDFESYLVGDTPVTNFTELDTDAWTIVAPSFSGQAYQNEISALAPGSGAAGENSSAVVEFPRLATSSFYLATLFVIDSFILTGDDPNNTGTIGLVARAVDSIPAASGGDRYQVSYYLDDDGLGHPTGRLYLSEHNLFFGDSLNLLSSTALPVTIGDVYSLSLEGRSVGASLKLRATLTDLTTSSSISVGGTDSSNLLTGSFFGYFNHVRAEDGGSVAINADFDDYNVLRRRPH